MAAAQEKRLVGVVLAGGRSRRMGQDKASLLLGSETLLARSLRVLRPFVDELAVAARPGQELPPLPSDVLVLHDRLADQGPLRGLADALRQFQTTMGVLVLPVDGLVEPDLLAKLAAAFVPEEADAVVPASGAQRLPLPGIYAVHLLAKAEELLASPNRGLKHLLEGCRTAIVPLTADQARALSLDTPEQFAAASDNG